MEILGGSRIGTLGYTPDDNKKQFTGYERDRETALDFAQARYFGSAVGRFNSPDPYKIVAEVQTETDYDQAQKMLHDYLMQPQKWNGYGYVQNNPLKYVDPSGEDEVLTGSAEDQRHCERNSEKSVGNL